MMRLCYDKIGLWWGSVMIGYNCDRVGCQLRLWVQIKTDCKDLKRVEYRWVIDIICSWSVIFINYSTYKNFKDNRYLST